MTLVDWWVHAPERLGRNVPTVIKITLILWALIGIVIALIPDLQQMNPVARFVLGAPAALGILWMAVSVMLKLADQILALAARLGLRKAR